MGRNPNRIGSPAGWFARTLVAVGLIGGVMVAGSPAAHATPVNAAAAQEVTFSVSDGSSYEEYLVRDCADPDRPGCHIVRVPGSITFRITVDISFSDRTTTVHYQTANGGAQAPGDYTAVSGTLSFPPGVFSKTVRVGIRNGGGVEPTETFRLRLSSPNVPADVSDAGIGTIFDGQLDL